MSTQMGKRPRSESVFFDGPDGRIEGLLQSPQGSDPLGVAVICHPHPQHGGTLQNKVVHTLARAFVSQGFLALRFNFRGVGRSEGKFDEGRGELQDALAAAGEARERVSGVPLWIGGFSFGAAIAVQAAALCDANGLICVAPAISRVEEYSGAQPDCPWLVIQGEEDELVDAGDTIEWVNSLDPGPELQTFEATGHFFHGKLVKLRKAVELFVQENEKKPGQKNRVRPGFFDRAAGKASRNKNRV